MYRECVQGRGSSTPPQVLCIFGVQPFPGSGGSPASLKTPEPQKNAMGIPVSWEAQALLVTQLKTEQVEGMRWPPR